MARSASGRASNSCGSLPFCASMAARTHTLRAPLLPQPGVSSLATLDREINFFDSHRMVARLAGFMLGKGLMKLVLQLLQPILFATHACAATLKLGRDRWQNLKGVCSQRGWSLLFQVRAAWVFEQTQGVDASSSASVISRGAPGCPCIGLDQLSGSLGPSWT